MRTSFQYRARETTTSMVLFLYGKAQSMQKHTCHSITMGVHGTISNFLIYIAFKTPSLIQDPPRRGGIRFTRISLVLRLLLVLPPEKIPETSYRLRLF